MLAAAFFLTIILVPVAVVQAISLYGLLINSWLALFNMIPFGFFDGLKIWRWNRAIYSIMAVAAFAMLTLPSLIVQASSP